MTSALLSQYHDVVALPDAWFYLDQRGFGGLVWDPEREEVVEDALPTVYSVPARNGLQLDAEQLLADARRACDVAQTIDAPVIYGGCLIRHFGHFIHECLSRLWWLAPTEAMDGAAKAASLRLQELDADVYFFMPKWVDEGKSLLPYMEEILALIGLPAQRIRIIQAPLRFRQLLLPACVWGFGSDPGALDQRLGCDTRALMRHLLASSAAPTPGAGEAVEGGKVYVSRSGLPINLGRLIGDVVLDPLLAAAGYRVFHPECCSIVEQIRVYAQAKDLIFMDGSSVYVLWLTKLRPGTRVRVILRRRQGRWMCEKVLELLPDAAQVRWEVVDALQGEALTSQHDWQSHNVANLGGLLRQLDVPVPPALPPPAEEALAAYAQALLAESTPEQLARVLQALMAALTTAPRRPLSRRERVYKKLRGLLASFRD